MYLYLFLLVLVAAGGAAAAGGMSMKLAIRDIHASLVLMSVLNGPASGKKAAARCPPGGELATYGTCCRSPSRVSGC